MIEMCAVCVSIILVCDLKIIKGKNEKINRYKRLDLLNKRYTIWTKLLHVITYIAWSIHFCIDLILKIGKGPLCHMQSVKTQFSLCAYAQSYQGLPFSSIYPVVFINNVSGQRMP